MKNFWKKLFYCKTDINEVKEMHKKDWNNPYYLQGVISSLLSDIKELQKENKMLRNKEGVWLSKEEVDRFNEHLKTLKIN